MKFMKALVRLRNVQPKLTNAMHFSNDNHKLDANVIEAVEMMRNANIFKKRISLLLIVHIFDLRCADNVH